MVKRKFLVALAIAGMGAGISLTAAPANAILLDCTVVPDPSQPIAGDPSSGVFDCKLKLKPAHPIAPGGGDEAPPGPSQGPGFPTPPINIEPPVGPPDGGDGGNPIWGGGNVPMPSPPIANVPGAPGYTPPDSGGEPPQVGPPEFPTPPIEQPPTPEVPPVEQPTPPIENPPGEYPEQPPTEPTEPPAQGQEPMPVAYNAVLVGKLLVTPAAQPKPGETPPTQ